MKNVRISQTNRVFFEVKNISRKDQKVKNVSFQLHKGEILGFAGLVGSGRSELMNAIFGAEPKSEGQIFMEGKELKINNPYEAIKNGLGMVTENRRETVSWIILILNKIFLLCRILRNQKEMALLVWLTIKKN